MGKIIYHCELCGENIVATDSGNSLSLNFKKHLKNNHQITLKEYSLQVYYNGVQPTCACGCGKEVHFSSKRYWRDNIRYGFGKYYDCTHVVKNIEEHQKTIEKMKNTNKQKWNDENWRTNYIEENWGVEKIKKAAFDFLHGKSYEDIIYDNNLKIDKRTLKRIWLELNLISEEEYVKCKNEHQFHLTAKLLRYTKFANAEELCAKLYAILKSNPLKYNIRSLIRYFNSYSDEDIKTAPEIVYEQLKTFYGDEIDTLLTFGNHSKEEVQFGEILYFYFKKKHVLCGKKLRFGANKRFTYVYDFCINNKLMIEYDGEGYYHNDQKTIEYDIKKENFAKEKGYNFIRLSYKDIHNIETLLKIKELL